MGNWDLVDLVDLVNLFNSSEIYKNTRRDKETIGAAFGRAPQGRGAPLWMLSLLNVIILCLNIWIQRIMTPILYSYCMISYMYTYIYIYIYMYRR